MKRYRVAQYYGIIAGITVLCIHFLASLLPYSIINNLYTSGIYVFLKWVLWPLQCLPFPSIYLIVLGFLTVTIWHLRSGYRKDQKIWKAGLRFINIVGWMVLLFYVLWAFNYRSTPLKDRLQLEDIQPDTTAFKQLYSDVTDHIIEVRSKIKEDSIHSLPVSIHELSASIDSLQRDWLRDIGLPVGIPARVKPLPEGMLLRISTAGFYFPYGGEGYYDKGLHIILVPFVIAHELSHNYGITDEGEANFAAFRVCLSSDNEYIQYSALLDFWRYLAVSYRRLDQEAYTLARDTLPATILNDLEAIRTQHRKFPDLFPRFRDIIYDSYLQTQGVQSGLQSYAQVIELEMAYRRKYPTRN